MGVITYEEHVVGSEGMSCDLILWQRFRRPMPGLFERVMDLHQNQHLEHSGFTILPIGTVVTIPIEEQPVTREPVTSLWD